MKKQLPGIAWAVIIFILSNISIGNSILPDFWDLFSLDKIAHAFFYFMLFHLWAHGLFREEKTKKPVFLVLLIFCILYGALLELYQGYFLPYRNGDWMDEVANGIGSFSAYLYYLHKIKRALTYFKPGL